MTKLYRVQAMQLRSNRCKWWDVERRGVSAWPHDEAAEIAARIADPTCKTRLVEIN